MRSAILSHSCALRVSPFLSGGGNTRLWRLLIRAVLPTNSEWCGHVRRTWAWGWAGQGAHVSWGRAEAVSQGPQWWGCLGEDSHAEDGPSSSSQAVGLARTQSQPEDGTQHPQEEAPSVFVWLVMLFGQQLEPSGEQ